METSSKNTKLAPETAVIGLPDKTTVTQAQFTTLRNDLPTQQDVVQIARGVVARKKDYSDEDAGVTTTNLPGATREFVTPFGLNQPGARVAMKVYVILNTGNEAGSAAMFVQRPANVALLAA